MWGFDDGVGSTCQKYEPAKTSYSSAMHPTELNLVL